MADFYGTAAGFRAYHTARGRELIVADDDDAEINAKLLIASEWIDGKFRASFGGSKVGQRAQVREWPRNGAMDRDWYSIAADSVPVEAINATYEAALRELVTSGSLSIDWTPGKYKRVSVDGAISVEYASFDSVADIQTQFAIIEQIIAPILNGRGGNLSGLSGAITRV
jgi:hypothetical protein